MRCFRGALEGAAAPSGAAGREFACRRRARTSAACCTARAAHPTEPPAFSAELPRAARPLARRASARGGSAALAGGGPRHGRWFRHTDRALLPVSLGGVRPERATGRGDEQLQFVQDAEVGRRDVAAEA